MAILLLASVAAGCGGVPGTAVDATVDSGGDANGGAVVDASADLGHDASIDSGPVVFSDSGHDATDGEALDASTHAGPDAADDAPVEVGPADAGPDDVGEGGEDVFDVSAPEAAIDVAPDLPVDAGFDTGPDLPVDAGFDTGPDLPLDAGFDIAPDLPVDVTPDLGPEAARDVGPDVCPTGHLRCGGLCVDISSDRANCGDCGLRCAPAQTCTAWACRCPSGETLCSGECVNLQTDARHCAGCFAECPRGQTCVARTCRLPCAQPRVVCGTGAAMTCVDAQSDPAHCGGCGAACPTGQACVAGACRLPCASPRVICGTGAAMVCVDTQDHASHCGGCGAACPTGQTCVAGVCRLLCAAPRVACGAGAAMTCVDTRDNPAHCGGCGAACPTGQPCRDGTCRALWSRRYFGSVMESVATDGGEVVYLVGTLGSRTDLAPGVSASPLGTRDGLLVSYSLAGTYRWHRAFGVSTAAAQDVAVDRAGNVFVVGRFTELADFGSGYLIARATDAFVASYSASNAFRWAVRIGGAGVDQAVGVGVDAQGNVYVTGDVAGPVTFAPGVEPPARSNSDVFVASYASDGAFRWARRFGDSGIEHANDVALDAAGNAFVTGYWSGISSFGGGFHQSSGDAVFLFSLTSDGAHRWARVFISGPNALDSGRAVGVDPQGNVWMAGHSYGPIDLGGGTTLPYVGAHDGFVASYTGAGVFRSARSIGGPRSDSVGSIAFDPAGNLFISGEFSGSIDLGSGPLDAGLANNGFVASYSAAGALRFARRSGGSASSVFGRGLTVDRNGGVLASGLVYSDASVDYGGVALPARGSRVIDGYLMRLELP